MPRKIVACPACQARFDVSSFKPGSKIRCGSCYKILLIPADKGSSAAAPAAKKPSAPVSGQGRKPAAPKAPVPSRKKAVPSARKAPAKSPARKPATKKRAAAPRDSRPAAPPELTPVPGTAPAPPEPVPAKKAAPVKKAAPAKPKQDPLIGQKINNEFEIVGILGQGGYGTVYEAQDLALKRRVALKLMLREKTSNKEFVDKFLREARTAAMLSHPNIVRIHLVGFSQDLQQHFLAMEYVEGVTLSDIMSKDGAVPADRAVEIMIQGANGLAEAHRKNIIHRDIKPGNVMITPKGVVKIADFGLAKVYDPDAAASTVIGTPYFMPPEQFEGKARDGRPDIHAVGVTYNNTIPLTRPSDGPTPAEVLMNVLRSDPVPPMEHNADVPEELWPIIRRMIARKLDDRYSTCDEILRDLKAFQSGAESEEKAFCAACGFANAFTAQACLECGASLLEPCPSCGTPDVVGAKFCGACGANLVQEKEIAGLVAEAQSHIASGRLEQALDKFSDAKDLSPENSEVIEGVRRTEEAIGERDRLVLSIEELIEDGSFLEALPLAEEAADRFPGHEPIAALQGRALGGAKNAQFSAALEEAQILLHSGDLFDACASARRALEIDPDSGEARKLLEQTEAALEEHVAARDLAIELEEQRKLPEALDSWKQALAVLPGDEAAEQAVARIEGVLDQLSRLRSRAVSALDDKDLRTGRSALEDSIGVLPGDPETLDLVARLRELEHDVASRFSAALGNLAEGAFEAGGTKLKELMHDYQHAARVAEASEKADALLGIAQYFRDTGELLLNEHRREMARGFLWVAHRIAPGDEKIEALFKDAERSVSAAKDRLVEARGLVEEEKYARALEILESLGGMMSPNAEVGELSVRSQDELQILRAASRDRKREVVNAALGTARELFQAGRVQAAHAACQKALRTDPSNETARTLMQEVDRALDQDGQSTGDSKIETAFFEFKDLGLDE